MVTIVIIAHTELTRLLRDRSNLFFVFIFPLLLVLAIGSQFGGSAQAQIGVVAPDDDPLAQELIEAIDAAEGIGTVVVDDRGQLRDEVAQGQLSAGVVIPTGYTTAVEEVEQVEIAFVGRPDQTAAGVRALVAAAVSEQSSPGRAALLSVGREQADDLPDRREVALGLLDEVGTVEVATRAVGSDELAEEFAGLGQFDLGASSQLFLFTFLTSLSGSAALIQLRRLGIAHRMLATPTSLRRIVGGLAAGRILIAALQAGYIMAASVLLFAVDWGALSATLTVVGLFCVISAAAGILIGSALSNDSQAGGVGVGLGLGFAALGGSMVPLELFPEGLRLVSRVTPHAWANEAMAEIVRRDGTLLDVLPQVAALVGFAAVLLPAGVIVLRRTLSQ
ncbi:MAG: ABC transporter permease [Nitriliruptoraceae bacterium]